MQLRQPKNVGKVTQVFLQYVCSMLPGRILEILGKGVGYLLLVYVSKNHLLGVSTVTN